MVKIRLLEERDCDHVNKLHEKTFHQTLNLNDYLIKLNYYVFVLEIKGEILGYLIGQIIFESADIYYVAINPQYYNKGYGKQLVQTFIDKTGELGGEIISLEVRVSNLAAIALYEKCGFVRLRIRNNYYANGEDALMMVSKQIK